MPPQRKPQTADERAKEALDRATAGATPARRTLDFLLKGSHDEPGPDPAQSPAEPSPIQTQTEPKPKAAQSQPKPSPIAPERNFNKRANSLEHSALPLGLFPGASKKIYDALYVRTRGAVVPTRTVQARHRELMQWSGIKDVKTVKTHLNKLREQGLISWQTLKGEHEGSFYEVFLPEEVSPDLAQSKVNPNPNLKTDSDPAQNLDWVGLPKSADSQRPSDTDKTSFKTNTERTDDDAAAVRTIFFERFEALSKSLTGKGIRAADVSKWSELFEVLETEARIAAGRTTVSSVPAFLAEHLRRRLWKKGEKQIAEEAKAEIPHSAIRVDASQCPDCFGTGMYYPEGFDKGVARCKHEKLVSKSENS